MSLNWKYNCVFLLATSKQYTDRAAGSKLWLIQISWSEVKSSFGITDLQISNSKWNQSGLVGNSINIMTSGWCNWNHIFQSPTITVYIYIKPNWTDIYFKAYTWKTKQNMQTNKQKKDCSWKMFFLQWLLQNVYVCCLFFFFFNLENCVRYP